MRWNGEFRAPCEVGKAALSRDWTWNDGILEECLTKICAIRRVLLLWRLVPQKKKLIS